MRSTSLLRLYFTMTLLAAHAHASAVVTPSNQNLSSPVDDRPECRLEVLQAERALPSDEIQGDYWNNMMGKDIVMFTGANGNADRFQAFDLKNNVPIRLTYEIDPFPAPDGRRMYVHPQPIRFYSFDEIRDAVENQGVDQEKVLEKALYTDDDKNMGGYYQSLGVLKSVRSGSKNYSQYRILTGQSEGSIKEYQVDFDANDRPIKVTPLRKEGLTLCRNLRGADQLNLDFDTPILSPKGDEFAVISRKTKSTVILTFDPKSGNCKVVLDLGFETQKVHFSPDGSKIAFGANSVDPEKINVPSETVRPFVYDRRTKTLTSLHVGNFSEDAHGNYPVFLPNGNLLYQRSSWDPEVGRIYRSWVEVDPRKNNSAPIGTHRPNVCSKDGARSSALRLLENLWKEVCTDDEVAQMAIIQMNPAACRALVNANWKEKGPEIIDGLIRARKYKFRKEEDRKSLAARFSLEKMLSVCPTRELAKTGPSLQTEGAKLKFPLVIKRRCAVCHLPGSPHGYIPWDDPEALRGMKAIGLSAKPGKQYAGKSFVEQLEDILDKNLTGKTPPEGVPRVPADGERLKPAEMQQILNWVKDGKKGEYKP